MSGVTLELKGQQQVQRALNQLLRHSRDMEPALSAIGEYLDESTKQRFIDQQAPDGEPWEPLSETTISRKKRPDRILTESGTLAANLHYQVTGNELQYGSNEVYAAMQHFGGVTSPFSLFPNAEIPARPFLGIAPFERAEILAILREYLDTSPTS